MRRHRATRLPGDAPQAARPAVDTICPPAYVPGMRRRLRHAARFGITTLVAVYMVGAAWELIDAYLLGNADPGLGPSGTFRFNETTWRLVAGIEAAVVFLLRLGDMYTRPPSWLYAWAAATLLGVGSVAVGIAVDEQRWWLAAALVVITVAAWYLSRRRIPGCPVARPGWLLGRRRALD